MPPGVTAGPNPCAVVSPSVAAVANLPNYPASVGSALVANPEQSPVGATGPTTYPSPMHSAAQISQYGRPDVWNKLVTNVSAGAVMVGGMIQHSIIKTLDTVESGVQDGIGKMRQGIDKTESNMKNGIDKMRKSIVKEKDKVDDMVDIIRQQPVNVPPVHVQLQPIGTLPPVPPVPPVSQWKIMGKDEKTKNIPAARSQKRVPPAVGSGLLSLFQSWNSPGSLCMMGLFGVLITLVSLTSIRGLGAIRRTVCGYAQVSLPAAMRSSRELDGQFTARERLDIERAVDSVVEADGAGMEISSRRHLIEMEVE